MCLYVHLSPLKIKENKADLHVNVNLYWRNCEVGWPSGSLMTPALFLSFVWYPFMSNIEFSERITNIRVCFTTLGKIKINNTRVIINDPLD